VQLVSKITNLCDPDPPTSQTDDMQSQDRALHYRALRGNKTEHMFVDVRPSCYHSRLHRHTRSPDRHTTQSETNPRISLLIS